MVKLTVLLTPKSNDTCLHWPLTKVLTSAHMLHRYKRLRKLLDSPTAQRRLNNLRRYTAVVLLLIFVVHLACFGVGNRLYKQVSRSAASTGQFMTHVTE